jgi:hypothetical protein
MLSSEEIAAHENVQDVHAQSVTQGCQPTNLPALQTLPQFSQHQRGPPRQP